MLLELTMITVSKNLNIPIEILPSQKVGSPLIQDWCFQDIIPNTTFDCVLMLLQHDGSTNAKLTEKERG